MRLSCRQKKAILLTFQQYFKEGDHLWLFGSRIDSQRKGGDIDLYIETSEKEFITVLECKIAFLGALQNLIGEQKIDVVINTGDTDLPIYHEARTNGIQLL